MDRYLVPITTGSQVDTSVILQQVISPIDNHPYKRLKKLHTFAVTQLDELIVSTSSSSQQADTIDIDEYADHLGKSVLHIHDILLSAPTIPVPSSHCVTTSAAHHTVSPHLLHITDNNGAVLL
jgi:hypothetical protein